MSYVIFWKCSEDYGEETFKIILTVYDNDLLQVIVSLLPNYLFIYSSRSKGSASFCGCLIVFQSLRNWSN